MKKLILLLCLLPSLTYAGEYECLDARSKKIRYTISALKERYLVVIFEGREYTLDREFRIHESSYQFAEYIFQNEFEIVNVTVPSYLKEVQPTPTFTSHLSEVLFLSNEKFQTRKITTKCHYQDKSRNLIKL